MEKTFEKLIPKMQERLQNWRKKTLPIKNEEPIRGHSPLNRRSVRRDYGDDISDYQNKTQGK